MRRWQEMHVDVERQAGRDWQSKDLQLRDVSSYLTLSAVM
jgi:hypothetical protein